MTEPKVTVSLRGLALALLVGVAGLVGEPRDAAAEEPRGAQDAQEETEVDARIRQLQEALLREVDLLEARLFSLKGRIHRLCVQMGAEAGGEDVDPAEPAWRSVEDEKKYLGLREKEAALISSWKKLGLLLAEVSGEGAENQREKLQAERAAVRSSLREVLREELELRDRARRLEVERLRQDLAPEP